MRHSCRTKSLFRFSSGKPECPERAPREIREGWAGVVDVLIDSGVRLVPVDALLIEAFLRQLRTLRLARRALLKTPGGQAAVEMRDGEHSMVAEIRKTAGELLMPAEKVEKFIREAV